MTPEACLDAARRLVAARTTHTPITALPDACRPDTVDQGYAVQSALHGLLDARGQDLVAGRKIGCTTRVMQAFLGIDMPCAGRMRGAALAHGHGAHRLDRHVRPAVEAEIAITLAAALAPASAPYDRAGVARAVGSCHASIEVVDDRYDDFRTLGVPTLVADDFFHAGCVLGPPRKDWRTLDLEALGCRLRVDGEVRGAGRGADIMGHPLEALAWLANHCATRGETLAAGDVVTLGSLVETHWIDGPCEIGVEIDGLGEARATFG
jgi:2-oxo-3-hexenedioate decarboxylase/2-keto-4-pentenoate hydratase